MNIKEFLLEKKRYFLLAGILMVITVVVCLLVFPPAYRLPIVLIIILLTLFLAALGLFEELSSRTALHELILQDLDELQKTPDYSVPASGTQEERELSNGINTLSQYIASLRTENEKERSDLADYIRVWSPKLEENLIEFRNIANSALKSDLPNLLERQADQTNLVVQQLLYYLRTKTDGLGNRKVPVSVNEMALQTIKRYYSFMQQKRIGYLIKGQDIIINTDPDILSFAFGQVLHNAIKYSPRKGSIGIYIKKFQDNYYLIVEDKGSGISPSDLPHVFEKNYVGKNELDEHSPGMGLYLAKSFVELMGYQIGLNSKLNQGTTVAICFSGEVPVNKNGSGNRSAVPAAPKAKEPVRVAEEAAPATARTEDEKKPAKKSAPPAEKPPRKKPVPPAEPPEEFELDLEAASDENEGEGETYLSDEADNVSGIERFVSKKSKTQTTKKKADAPAPPSKKEPELQNDNTVSENSKLD